MPKTSVKTDTQSHPAAQADTQARPAHRKPTYRLYCVKGDGDAASWTPIGAAWPNKDGMGFSLTCDAVPLQGRLVLRAIQKRTTGGAEQGDLLTA